MRLLFLAGLVAGCAAAVSAPAPAPRDVPLRNPTARMASQSNATAARMAGDWRVTQGAGLAPGTRIRITDEAWTIAGRVVRARFTGQGRFETAEGPLWVHWLDVSARTAAVGDPGGSRVWIMDRAAPSPDRALAARQVLDWYGYDLSRLSPSD